MGLGGSVGELLMTTGGLVVGLSLGDSLGDFTRDLPATQVASGIALATAQATPILLDCSIPTSRV